MINHSSKQQAILIGNFVKHLCILLSNVESTKETASETAMAKMSAHETVLLQTCSSSALMVSTTWNPLAEFRFGNVVFSPTD
jgi:hypothetical protein